MSPIQILPSPLQSFRHCPNCGHPEPLHDSLRSIRCAACGFRYFVNSAATVCAFVFYGDRLILTQRARDPQKGTYDFPGGFMEWGESAEEALHREIAEELGIQVHSLAYVCSTANDYPYAGVTYKLADFYFLCRTDDISMLQPQDDVAGVLWVKPDAVDTSRLSFPSVREAHGKLLAYLAGDPLSNFPGRPAAGPMPLS